MDTHQRSAVQQVGGKVADRLTVLLGLNGLLLDQAFGPLSDRQQRALYEMLQTTEELRTILTPLMRER
jgi:hypothetical protein